MTADAPALLPQHAALLCASGIGEAVARERGYESVTRPVDLGRRGFKEAQKIVPALLLPVWGVGGAIVNYQSGPDQPRIGPKGKPIKYETPARSQMALDVPPRARRFIGDPTTPLHITEGIRKADAAVSHGIDCCLSLLGVYNWRGSNDDGGKVALPDWESVALNGRETYIVFDSDVMTNPRVYGALARFRGFLGHRGALVRLVYLPSGERGAKVGLDDFLAAGHTPADLLALAEEALRPAPADDGETAAGSYRARDGGFFWRRQTRDGWTDTALTNFQARIVGEVSEDDGAETRRTLEMIAQSRERRRAFHLPIERFAAMNWPLEQLGTGAIVYPGMGLKDHARTAIQLLSGDVPERTVYAHTGWREHDGEWVYLHNGGAIGAGGAVPGVGVALPPALAGYSLPDPSAGEGRRDAIRAGLRILDLAPDRATIPLLGAVYRAPLGGADFGLFLEGRTGAGKSELAALVQQHHGPAMTSRALPASWSSTDNALEGQAFQVKDGLLTIDDFAPHGSPLDMQRYHQKADRVFRGQGNHAGRARLFADGRLRPTRPPRGLILATGEDVPRGQSIRARLLILELAPGDLDFAALTACQRDAASGAYADALAGYVSWLAPRVGDLARTLLMHVAELRGRAALSAGHRRTPEIVAGLAVGWLAFIAYARDSGALSADEAAALWARVWRALGEATGAQVRQQGAADPVGRFLTLLRSALGSGAAHIAGRDGREPGEPTAWGWRERTIGTGEYERTEWQPQGTRIGWLDGGALYLDGEAAYTVAHGLGARSGEGLPVGAATLRKRLNERGHLIATDGKRQTLTVRRRLEEQTRDVLHLAADLATWENPTQPDTPASDPWAVPAALPPLSDFFTPPGVPPETTSPGDGAEFAGHVGLWQVDPIGDAVSSVAPAGGTLAAPYAASGPAHPGEPEYRIDDNERPDETERERVTL